MAWVQAEKQVCYDQMQRGHDEFENAGNGILLWISVRQS